jgi:hypothetical protein
MAYAQVPTTATGLLRLWSFEEINGAKSFDSISFDTMTLTATTQGVSGKYGLGVHTTETPGGKGVSTLKDFMGLSTLNAYTVSFWIYYTSYSDIGNVPIMFDMGNTAQGFAYNNCGESPGDVTYRYIRFQALDSLGAAFNLFSATTSIKDINTWYNFVWTFSRTDKTAKLYINSNLHLQVFWVTDVSFQTTNATLNFFNLPGLTNSGDATFDDWAVFNYTMTPAQISDVYNNVWGSPATTTNTEDSNLDFE